MQPTLSIKPNFNWPTGGCLIQDSLYYSFMEQFVLDCETLSTWRFKPMHLGLERALQLLQWNLFTTATCGPVERWLQYRGRLQCISAMLVLFGSREAGWFKEVTTLYTVTILCRQISL